MRTAAILGFVMAIFGATASSATEQPVYSVVEKTGAVEIRQYGPRLAAEATVSGREESARNDGFRKVAGFIFGGNTAKASIAMTAPVVQASAGRSEKIAMTAPVVQTADPSGAWRIQFIMPAKYTRATLPVPTDPSVRIVDVPAETYAVIRFSGSRDGKAVSRRTAELTAALAAAGWRATGQPVAWFYDPPWTLPAFRRNEVAVTVERAL